MKNNVEMNKTSFEMMNSITGSTRVPDASVGMPTLIVGMRRNENIIVALKLGS